MRLTDNSSDHNTFSTAPGVQVLRSIHQVTSLCVGLGNKRIRNSSPAINLSFVKLMTNSFLLFFSREEN